MSNYTKQISWSGKDALSDSDSEKVISGGDFDTEFSAVQTAINGKIDGGTITNFTSTGIDDNATSTAITIDSAEHVSLAHGIGFNGDTAAANALDDYEEGTWTPSFSNSSITDGSYVKIGSMVYIAGKISCTGAGSSGATISGLPFAPINSSSKQGCGIVGYHNINVTEVYSILVSLGSATFSFQLASTAIECSAGANMRFNITYQTAS